MARTFFGSSKGISQSRLKILSQNEHQFVEKHREQLAQLEKLCKSVSVDVKRCSETLRSLSRSERKTADEIVNGLASGENVHLRNLTSEWLTSIETLEQLSRDLDDNLHIIVAHPMKKLNSIFPAFFTSYKKWLSVLQECVRQQEKLEKLEQKEQNAQNQNKLNECRRSLAASKEQLQMVHDLLKTDMELLLKERANYVQPVIDGLAQAEAGYYTSMHAELQSLCTRTGAETLLTDDEDAHRRMVEVKLKELRSLSITAD